MTEKFDDAPDTDREIAPVSLIVRSPWLSVDDGKWWDDEPAEEDDSCTS